MTTGSRRKWRRNKKYRNRRKIKKDEKGKGVTRILIDSPDQFRRTMSQKEVNY